MEPLSLIIIFITGFACSFFGVVVGAEALITVPVLIFTGLLVYMAVATNKLNALGVTIGGLYKFGKSKKVDYRVGFFLAVFTFDGE